ncbi:MAG: hypothetical protein HZA91_06355 [Verrucomicrobia bacterium]|nr:hypothetical protein [Verrucomicrobiota bacterium]
MSASSLDFRSGDGFSRRAFLALLGTGAASPLFAGGGASPAQGRAAASTAGLGALRRDIVDSPFSVGLHRAKVFTEVFRKHEAEPWIVRKAMALREYFETVPLYLREHDGIAGSISERGGAMPVMVELGIGENNIYLSERPDRKGHLKGRVPDDIRDFWKNRNMWGRYRIEILGQPPVKSHDELPQNCPNYKLISNQGHLCPSYTELLRVGIGGLQKKVAARRQGESNTDKLAFLTAAEHTLAGLSTWAQRYSKFLAAEGKQEMSCICGKIATQPPETFREALQLVWLAHQAIHIEGHGYSCTPDRLDQLLLPFYEADPKAGRLDDAD